MARLCFNNHAVREATGTALSRAPLEFHRRLPGYRPTPLHRLPELADRLGVGDLWVKDESNRLGLPAFKILGASWAVYRAAIRRLGFEPEGWSCVEELRAEVEPLRPLELVAATDGNHGRGVARVAKHLGFDARIFVPAGTARARIAALESEGAVVIVVDGTYDDTVARAAEAQGERSLLIQDTSWSGYEEITRWVVEGYSTMFWEIDDALAEGGEPGPDLVFVQVGVGSLAAAAVSHYRREGVEPLPRIIAVEPAGAACALRACEVGDIVTVPGPHESIMAGLNCGTLSRLAWPVLRSGVDLFMAVDDHQACAAMRELAESGVVSGESGAAGLAGLVELLTHREDDTQSGRLEVDRTARVLVISTEGSTDPATYERVVGRPPCAVCDGLAE